jgi:hypothetical protein
MLLKKCIIQFFILLCFSCGLFAQVDNQTNNRISSIEESEISEREKQTLVEDLYFLSLNPVNIN